MIQLQTSLGGILVAEDRMSAAATKLAGLGAQQPESAPAGDQVSLSREALALLEGRHQVAVNARVVQRLDELNASVLDILA